MAGGADCEAESEARIMVMGCWNCGGKGYILIHQWDNARLTVQCPMCSGTGLLADETTNGVLNQRMEIESERHSS